MQTTESLDPFFLLWTRKEALELCQRIEDVCTPAGCHVALTGGLLYKDGPRKDCDLLFYRIRQTPDIDLPELFRRLRILGFKNICGFGWCFKSSFKEKPVDIFFPEETQKGVVGIPGHNNVHTY